MHFVKSLILTVLAFTAVVYGNKSKKIFIDNDGATTPDVLIPIFYGYEILGYSASFGSSSLVDSVGATYNVLDMLNMTKCIPLYVGANNPLIRTNDSFHRWEDLYGTLYWQGGFSPDYQDMYSWADIQYNEEIPGALALINAVKKYPGEVEVYAAGTMTTVAQALSIYPDLVEDAAGLTIMGGYIDGQYVSAVEGGLVSDLFSDINLIQDPEAAQIALTAPWKSVTIAGNITNSLFHTTDEYQKIIKDLGGLGLIQSDPKLQYVKEFVGNGTAAPHGEENLPYWDEMAVGFVVNKDLIKQSVNISFAIDTAFDSPFYGQLRLWPENLAPKKGIRIGRAQLITEVDSDMFLNTITNIYTQDWSSYCTTNKFTKF
jgi:inosine-uridine nucleoside N-ribohydrolase